MKSEQNTPRDSSVTKVLNKKLTNRKLRRAAKKDPESAPRKPRFKGYSM